MIVYYAAMSIVGQGPALADGAFPLPRFRLAEVERYHLNGVRLRYER